MGAPRVDDAILSELYSGYHDHSVNAFSPFGFARQDFEILWKRLAGEGSLHHDGRFTDEALVFTQVVGDRDCAEPEFAMEIDQLRYRELSVAKRRVHMEVG